MEKGLISVKKFLVIILTAAALLLLTGCGLDETEKKVEENAHELKLAMDNPDSFTIIGDITVVESTYSNGAPRLISLIEYTFENQYGGTSRANALFSEGAYLGTYLGEPASSAAELNWATAGYELAAGIRDGSQTYVDGGKIARAIDANHVS